MSQIKEITEKIWRIDSSKRGPRLAILGGIHGNERTGIEIVKQLYDLFASNKKILARGTLYLMLGNLQAMKKNARYTAGGNDLNRLFNPNLLKKNPRTYEEKRAREIAKVLRAVQISIDIHATNKPSLPFLACLASPRHAHIYRWFEADRVLTDPHQILGGMRVTTDEYVDELGGVGMCYETGWAEDMDQVPRTITSLLDILRDQRMIKDGIVPKPSKKKKKIFELTERLDLTKAGFRYAPGVGTSSFQKLKTGTIIGYVGERLILAKENEVIVFPKLPNSWKIGQPVGYMAKRIK